MKRSSPQFIALIASVIAALVSSVSVWLVSDKILAASINFGAVFLFCFIVFSFLLKEFIHDRINLIYKNIYRFKTRGNNKQEAIDKKSIDPIGDVSKEVISWMRENKKEVDELKEQENYRREFLGNVSHELKTPIQNIQGYIHTLLDGALNDKKVNELFLNKAANSADRLVELVNDLTTISTIDAGKEINLETIDLLQLSTEVLEIVEPFSTEKNITVSLKKQNHKTVLVKGDKAKIRQVLVNLIINAVKYGNEGGKVTIAFFDMDKSILTEVTDDGIGIAEEHIPRLFERFYRTDKGRSRDQGGSGLGLAIVKHIIEAHKQTINVRSTLGVGSTFGFTLRKG